MPREPRCPSRVVGPACAFAQRTTFKIVAEQAQHQASGVAKHDFARASIGSIIAALLLFSDAAIARGADESPLKIRAVEAWAGVFGRKETEFHFEVTSSMKADVLARWTMTADERVLARRETSLTVAPDKPGTIAVHFELPPAREGIVVPLDLSVGVESGNDRASLEKRLWLFADDPFALKKDWLNDLKMALFDPVGETARQFTDAEVPFESVRTVDGAANIGEGVLVVGEGASWSKQRALPKLVLDLASKGVGVLVLSPSDGVLPMPGSDAENVLPAQSLLLRRTDIITELDKWLDAVAWPPEGELQANGLQITAERGRVVARVVEGREGWPWLECRFSAPQSRLIVCGFPVIKRWGSGPTPRYLFARMLERLVDADKEPDDKAERENASNH